jgi:hypothetical protein
LPDNLVAPTIFTPYTLFRKKEIFPFKKVFFSCFQIVFRGYLDTDRDTDLYTVKRKYEAWRGDMLLTKKMCRAERAWRICIINWQAGRRGEGKVGRVPERGQKEKCTAELTDQILMNKAH